MKVPANTVFRVGRLAFTDEGEEDGTFWVGVYAGMQIIERLPLDEAKVRYAGEFDRVRYFLDDNVTET